MVDDRRFEGQVALVTGAAQGLGKAISARLAREGAQMVLLDADQARLEAVSAEFGAQSWSVTTVQADVASEDEVKRAFEITLDTQGRLDVVVNSAGIVGPNNVRITQVEAGDYDRVYRVNQLGSFLVAKHALKAMEARDYGRVLLIASIAGKEGNAGMCAYSSTKAAVIGLVKSVGKEYAETDITVNALAPAVIRTAMVEGMEPAQVKYMTDRIPMKRCGTLDEVAAIAAWIVSPEASFTTGFTFDLSGGRATY